MEKKESMACYSPNSCFSKRPCGPMHACKCSTARTQDGKCHTIEGYNKPYSSEVGAFASQANLPGRDIGEALSEPYYQIPNHPLSCKWVTGPGGFSFTRCDNYQSYSDVAVDGTIKHPPTFKKASYRDGARSCGRSATPPNGSKLKNKLLVSLAILFAALLIDLALVSFQ
jgi:hypothetical protein